jgi:hypothetical protein
MTLTGLLRIYLNTSVEIAATPGAKSKVKTSFYMPPFKTEPIALFTRDMDKYPDDIYTAYLSPHSYNCSRLPLFLKKTHKNGTAALVYFFLGIIYSQVR